MKAVTEHPPRKNAATRAEFFSTAIQNRYQLVDE